MSRIGVVDCNNFFVSCERLFRPDLAKRPVAVLSSNDGCVVARSQEVKDMGVPMGVPYFKVKDIIKDNKVVLFSSHFTLYRDVSRRVFEVMRTILSQVEQYSIDEAFFVLNEIDNPAEIAVALKDAIETKVGIPVSVGIGASKTQAKYAVDLAKKSAGIKVLDTDSWEAECDSIKLASLWGVGQNLNKRYLGAGYETVADLLQADESRVKTLFGVGGERLLAELKGQSTYNLSGLHEQQKSMMSSRSFKEPATNKAVLEDAIAYHTRHIASDLRKQGLLASVVRISIQASRYSDFLLQGASLEAVLDRPSNDTLSLLSVTQKLLDTGYKTDVPYKKVGVSVGKLVSLEGTQETLFATEAEKTDNKRLMNIVDALNKKADRELVTLGNRLRGADWQAKKELQSPSYTTKWTDVVKVKA